MEKNKLYVQGTPFVVWLQKFNNFWILITTVLFSVSLGLPFSADKAALEKIFSPYGILKDIRIVTYRNGHSKGTAYVDYEDEVSIRFVNLKDIYFELIETEAYKLLRVIFRKSRFEKIQVGSFKTSFLKVDTWVGEASYCVAKCN